MMLASVLPSRDRGKAKIILLKESHDMKKGKIFFEKGKIRMKKEKNEMKKE